jgi:hypothetical protein
LEDLPNEKTLKKLSLYIKRPNTVKIRIKIQEFDIIGINQLYGFFLQAQIN